MRFEQDHVVTDLQAETLEGLTGPAADLVREVIADAGHDAFVDPRSVGTRQTIRVLGI